MCCEGNRCHVFEWQFGQDRLGRSIAQEHVLAATTHRGRQRVQFALGFGQWHQGGQTFREYWITKTDERSRESTASPGRADGNERCLGGPGDDCVPLQQPLWFLRDSTGSRRVRDQDVERQPADRPIRNHQQSAHARESVGNRFNQCLVESMRDGEVKARCVASFTGPGPTAVATAPPGARVTAGRSEDAETSTRARHRR